MLRGLREKKGKENKKAAVVWYKVLRSWSFYSAGVLWSDALLSVARVSIFTCGENV